MGDKDWRFPGTPGSTIRFPSFKKGEEEIMMRDRELQSYKYGDNGRL